mgnify:CR=1 FL=1|jgi:hypothetical protein
MNEKVAKTENFKTSALCGISEFEENEKRCVCFLYNCLTTLSNYRYCLTVCNFFSCT